MQSEMTFGGTSSLLTLRIVLQSAGPSWRTVGSRSFASMGCLFGEPPRHSTDRRVLRFRASYARYAGGPRQSPALSTLFQTPSKSLPRFPERRSPLPHALQRSLLSLISAPQRSRLGGRHHCVILALSEAAFQQTASIRIVLKDLPPIDPVVDDMIPAIRDFDPYRSR